MFSTQKQKILVIGAGVSGLSTAILLLKKGYEVEIWSKDLPMHTTSAVAAAFWFPFLAEPQDKIIGWSNFTRKYLEEHALNDQESGCDERDFYEFLDEPAGDPWWKGAVKSWRHLKEHEIPVDYKDGYSTRLILMDTTLYLPWLFNKFEELGGNFEQRKVGSLLNDTANYSTVVNCTGLGAQTLCDDQELYPVRGQVILIKPNGVNEVKADDSGHNQLAYIIPRKNDIVLGGTTQINNWDLEVNPTDTEEILKKAAILDSRFKNVTVLAEKVGLRPARSRVRIEKEIKEGKNIVHNYGHGGSGYTISWGCANEVVSLI
jgi:D-amino-acid oxidase